MTRRAPAFVLDPRLPAARAVRRAAVAQLDHALAALARGDAAAAHETRKVCKRLRGLLRLLRPLIGAAVYRADNRRLRDAARLLAPEREGEVLARMARELGTGPVRDTGRDGGARRHAARLLEAARRRTARWHLRGLSRPQLTAGLQRGYRAARRAMHQAQRQPDAARVHEWRKRAKYHGYQCELMSAAVPALRSRTSRLEALSDELGRHHDLEMLRLAVARGKHGARIGRKQERKAAHAFERGARLFANRSLSLRGDAP